VFLPPGAEALLPAVLTRLLAPDVTIPAGAPLRVTHRRIDDQEVYFLINDGPAPWTGPVQVAAEGAAERWDPKTGGRSTLAGNATDVTLEPYDSVLLRYARSRERPRRAWTAAGGLGLPEPRPLPDVKPTIGAGEHVAAEPMAELDPSGGFAGWRTVGQLRKGGVDTFLFLCFRYPEPVDVGDTEGLELQFDIPAGQNAGATLHVIVTEADKGQFLASMGRTVRQAGRYRTWVPWSRLHPAGWCKEGDGVLDRTRITEVHLGWGGYTGTAGERIEVHTAAPRVTAWATAAP
jgi:hypothetical protein